MTALHTVADYQDLARAVSELLPSAVPLVATLEPTPPAVSDIEKDFEVATLHYAGTSNVRLLLAVTEQTMAPLTQSGLDLGGSSGLPVLLESVVDRIGQGVVVGREVPLIKFATPSTVYFSLRAGSEHHGWFALNIQEVTPVFDENPTDAPQEASFGSNDFSQPASSAQAQDGGQKTLRMLYDVEMTLTAEIGRAKLPVRQILDLVPGAIVELDRVAGSAADLMVNGHLVARGEVVVIDEDYGLRITEIMDAAEGLL